MLDSKGFDLWADGYDKTVGLSDEDNTYPFAGYKDVLNTIYNEVLRTSKAEVLDIGFGTGALTTKLYEQGCQIWGQDFSQKMIELAKDKMPEANLYQGDFAKGLIEELKQHTYDAIIATYSLHHLTDDEKIIFLNSLMALLKDSGKIIIGDVAFLIRKDLETCKEACGEGWDDEESYFVYDEIKDHIQGKSSFQRISHCAGVIIIEKRE